MVVLVRKKVLLDMIESRAEGTAVRLSRGTRQQEPGRYGSKGVQAFSKRNHQF